MEGKYLELLNDVNRLGCWSVDIATQTVTWDHIVKEIHEVPKDFIPDLKSGINFYKEGYSRDKITEVVGNAMKNGSPYDVELQIVTAKNNVIWVRAIGRVVRDSSGVPIEMFGTFENIESYKQKENLAKNESDVIKDSGIGIWNWNPQTNEVDFSSGWKAMLGYSDSEIKNTLEEWSSRVHPEDIESCYSDIEAHLKGDVSIYRNEHRMKHKDGYWVWILDQGKIVEFDDEDKPIKFVGTHLDISSRVEEQFKSVEKDNKYSKIFESSTTGMLVIDKESNILECNATVCRMFEFDQEELMQSKLDVILPSFVRGQRHQGYVDGYRAEPSARKMMHNFEFKGVSKEGHEIPLDIKLNYFEQNGDVFAVAFLDDISEKLEVEKMKQEAEEMRQQNALAEESARNKQQFLANMSHEIRTPMNGIVGLVDVLSLDEDLTESQKAYISTIKNSSMSLLNIINDILELSKLEKGKMRILHAEFDLRKVLKHIKNLFFTKAISKGLNFDFVIAPDAPRKVIGDEHRLKQVLSNLISNAIKFTDTGSVSLSLCTATVEEKSVLKFSIKDTGIGMNPEELDGIFDIYEQADSSLTKQYEGTGLGLGIAKRIVSFLEGSITVESDYGVGTEFIVEIPFEEVEEDLKTKNSQDAFSTNSDLSALKILLVDDKQVNRTVAGLMLKQIGITPKVATNGKEAIEVLSKEKFDLVLMDIQMPVLNGLDATIQIREENISSAKILALTANAMEGDEDRYLSHGFDGYLPKPLQFKVLENALKKYSV